MTIDDGWGNKETFHPVEKPPLIEYRRTSVNVLVHPAKAPYAGFILSPPSSEQDTELWNAGLGYWTWEPVGQCATETTLHILWRGNWHEGTPHLKA